MYKIIFRGFGSNTPGCYFTQIDDYRTSLGSATSTAAAVVDHGNLTGLGDDDHTQYLLVDGSRAADTLTVTGQLTASGGIDGLTLANGGISGSNYNITGVNQLEIADPGEGIVFKGGASGDYSMYIIDDASDKILQVGGVTNSRVRVNAPSGNAEVDLDRDWETIPSPG